MQIAELSKCYGWRGKAYGPGRASIPDDLAIALGLATAPLPEPEVLDSSSGVTVNEDVPPPASPALVLINSGAKAADLTPIATIGTKAAAIILEQRPPAGYLSVEALPAEIFKAPYNCKAADILAWEG